MKPLLLAAALALITASGARADCADSFKALLEAMPKAGPYRYTIEAADGGQKDAFKKVVEAEYIFGTANHIKFGTREMLVTPAGAWEMADGKWKAMAAAETTAMQAGLKNPWYVHPENLKNVTCLGQQEFEGKAFATYGFDTEAFMGARTLQHVQVMAGDNNLPAVIRAEKASNGDRMLARLTFDSSIKIEAPQP